MEPVPTSHTIHEGRKCVKEKLGKSGKVDNRKWEGKGTAVLAPDHQQVILVFHFHNFGSWVRIKWY